MKNVKRVFAILLTVILLGMYITTFVMAFLDRSETMTMFKGCIAMTIFVPVVLYAYVLLHRLAKGRSDDATAPAPFEKSSDDDSASSEDKPD